MYIIWERITFLMCGMKIQLMFGSFHLTKANKLLKINDSLYQITSSSDDRFLPNVGF